MKTERELNGIGHVIVGRKSWGRDHGEGWRFDVLVVEICEDTLKGANLQVE